MATEETRFDGSTRMIFDGNRSKATRLILEITNGTDQGQTYVMGSTPVRIGSDTENELTLQDDAISRFHLEVTPTATGAQLKDLGSTNGTFVGGAQITEAKVSPGARFTAGATEFLLRPAEEDLEVPPSEENRFGIAQGRSLAMRQVFGVLERVSNTNATILLMGETGTGKGAIAQSIHNESSRSKKPMIVVDCGAIPAPLMESELFGHEKGAFTGAVAARRGAFELANDSTLFLDEIGELPLELQPKLLRVLESGEFRAVGSEQMRRTDVRIIAATNKTLESEVAEGKFREDLYFRLAVIRVSIPGLRERPEDIPLLIEHFMKDFAPESEALPAGTLSALQTYNWPGNVRELRNLVERSVVLSGGVIRAPSSQSGETGRYGVSDSGTGSLHSSLSSLTNLSTEFKRAKDQLIETFEKEYVRVLKERAGKDASVSEMARLAGLDRKHIRTLLERHEN